MTLYRCPRADLHCKALFESSGDLDDHYRWTHGYRRTSRYLASLRPIRMPTTGEPLPTRGEASGFGPSAATGTARLRRTRRETAGASVLSRHRARRD
ncbi:hypothetical protein BCD49_32380 [Pseudofrankia sp. EUN1h]|nr:hypothetical protein BCD49_32380 [Pseudofrankia sp. EUN1h]